MIPQVRRITSLLATLCAVLAGSAAAEAPPPTFDHLVIDATNPVDPHCKTLADVDGDGLLDGVVASSAGGGLWWYEAPGWTKHEIRATGSWTTDLQAGDLDDDGDPDLVLPASGGLYWYENPRPLGDPATDLWTEHLIGASAANAHDVELDDVDRDLDLDVVTRQKGGGGTYFWQQSTPLSWTRITVSTAAGEGTALGDLDGDDDLDVAHNGFWVEQVDASTWTPHAIDAGWPADVGVLIVDLDGDGVRDVVLGPSESAAGKLSWYSADDPVNGPWTEHAIDPSVSYLHTFKAGDLDGDGDLDLVTAEMHQSGEPDEVSVYRNVSPAGEALAWDQLVVATGGSHNIRVGDLENDGDLDLFGANWNDSAPNSAIVEAWLNRLHGPLPLDEWRRHVVETSLPWQAVFVDGRDLDGDGLPDLVTGGWWYPNPGTLGGTWTRTAIGSPFHNFAVAGDFDGDGAVDLLGTDGQVSGADLMWAENDGTGTFTLHDIDDPAPAGDFLQGAEIGPLLSGGGDEIVLAWHNAAGGTTALTVPADPQSTSVWPATPLSATTSSEQSPIADFDGDGDADVHLGTDWLEQGPAGTFTLRDGVTLAAGVPDRVVVGDVDGDDDLDVVIGVEFSNRLVWAENQDDGDAWVERLIATDVDYFSVGVADLDRDGDLDVVGGAHQGAGEMYVYENDGDGGGWTRHTIDAGDSAAIDHHDGARLVDLDLDGDTDVVSIGWSKKSLVVYENLALGGDGGGGGPGGDDDTTPPALLTAAAVGANDRVVARFDEPLGEASAENAAGYAITGGVAVLGAELGVDGRTVALTVSPLTDGVGYTLAVAGVTDLAGNPVAAGAEADFTFDDDVDPTAGLVAWWPLDDRAGPIARDVSGNGHDGALAGGPSWHADSALELDGVDDRVEAGSFDVAGSALTLAAWFRPDGLGNCGSADCRILSKAIGTAEGDHYFMLSTIESGGKVRLRFRLKTGGTTTTLIANTGDLAEDLWQHAAASYDGAAMRLYLDGIEVGSTAKAGALSANAAAQVWLGGNPPGPTDRPWSGRLDDLRIYARALSVEELRALPAPGVSSIFRDGFETADRSRWSGGAP